MLETGDLMIARDPGIGTPKALKATPIWDDRGGVPIACESEKAKLTTDKHG
jgi:hypothetical protein